MVYLQSGDTIERQGWFLHPAVFVGPRGPNGEDVVQNTPGRGVELVHFHEFAQGQQIRLRLRPSNWYEAQQVAARALNCLGLPYNLLFFNCEHMVTFAETGKADSQQVRAWVTLGLSFATVFAVIAGARAAKS
jgi:hypothetical protein